ncbi:MAG: ectonucleotide pyrophosphatase/phosphodiesterase, partial [Bacteroidota bacterium]
YLILISLDGFRYDYAERYGAKNLLAFDAKAESMVSSFPTKTFPNHYTIVTGLYPGHHGLVSNGFYDRNLERVYSTQNRAVVEDGRFYGGMPIWALAAKQEMVSASMFWIGSEARIQGETPTYHFKYNGDIAHQDRVNKVVQWLLLPPESRPHFISLYFSIIDDVGHNFGPNSPEMAKAVKDIDAVIGDLVAKVERLDLAVNIIVVSDHGMLEVDVENPIYHEDLFPDDMNITTSFPLMVYSDDSLRIDSLYKALKIDTSKYSVYRKDHFPDRYHYDQNSERIGDLILQPRPPYNFGRRVVPFGRRALWAKPGSSTHGYDPAECPEMGAIFYAMGPAFKSLEIKAFENIHVYPLMAEILGLEYDKRSIDGDLRVLESVLK